MDLSKYKIPVDTMRKIIDLNSRLNGYEYGFISRDRKHRHINTENFEGYQVLKPEEFEKYKIGVCWDYAIYEAWWFKKNLPDVEYHTWFIVYGNDDDCPTHTFLTFNFNGKWYWFESSYHKHQGIWESESEENILQNVLQYMNKDDYLERDLSRYPAYIVKYDALNPQLNHLSCSQFMKYMSNSGLKRVQVKDLKELRKIS